MILLAAIDLAYRRQVDDELILPVNADQGIEWGLVVAGHGTGAGADGLTRQVEVLADVAGVLGDELGSYEAVAPLGAAGESGPDEDDGRLGEPFLQGCLAGNGNGRQRFQE